MKPLIIPTEKEVRQITEGVSDEDREKIFGGRMTRLVFERIPVEIKPDDGFVVLYLRDNHLADTPRDNMP